ncbi:hypothetical protein ABEB36_011471 [Hypothenemus hampei]|uniref:CRAL-TRIO domain-containing protein n=1 Tax=Hypothenemus hampei TaxID=57062 RepID=A0ABD1EG60_HYPHA
MSKKLIELNKDKVYEQIQKELGKSKADIEKDVKIIQEWLRTQPHLPEIPEEILIQSFLLFNKFSIEMCKQKLDTYYTIRKSLPEFFDKHPCSPDMIKQARTSYVVPLPKLADDNRRIIYTKFCKDFPNQSFNQENFLAHIYNVFEVLLREDLLLGAHYIFDCSGFTMGHLKNINLLTFKKSSTVMEKVFSNRVTSINLINYHPIVENALSLVKTVLPEKVRSRIKVLKNTEALFQLYPKSMLPKDIGGDEEFIADLAELWIKRFEEKRELFDKLTTLRVDESKRPQKLVNDEVLGFYGNFKKLDID